MKTNILACGISTLLATLGFFASESAANEPSNNLLNTNAGKVENVEKGWDFPKYRENYLDLETENSELTIDRKGHRVRIEGEYRTEFLDFSLRYEPSKDKYSFFAGKRLNVGGSNLELGCRLDQSKDFCGTSLVVPLK